MHLSTFFLNTKWFKLLLFTMIDISLQSLSLSSQILRNVQRDKQNFSLLLWLE